MRSSEHYSSISLCIRIGLLLCTAAISACGGGGSASNDPTVGAATGSTTDGTLQIESPTTVSLAWELPIYELPSYETPNWQSPTTGTPATEPPTTEPPTTEPPTTEPPTTEPPTTEPPTTEPPTTEPSDTEPVITGFPSTIASVDKPYSFVPIAIDEDGDVITFSILNQPAWSMFNSQTGELSGTPDISQLGSWFDIQITVSDGIRQSTLSGFNIEVVEDNVELALLTGDVSVVSDHSKLELEAVKTINTIEELNNDAFVTLFNLADDGREKFDGSSLTSIDWDPGNHAALLIQAVGENSTVLTSNSSSDPDADVLLSTLAVAGRYYEYKQTESSTPYMVFAGNPMRNHALDPDSLNEQMHLVMENSLAWLTKRPDLKSTAFNVVIAHMDQQSAMPDEVATRNWLDERFPGTVNYNSANTCDASALAGCVTANTDLLILSQHMNSAEEEASITQSIRNALLGGTPVLYLSPDNTANTLGKRILDLIDVRIDIGNDLKKQSLSAFNPVLHQTRLPAEIYLVRTMMSNLSTDSFPFTLVGCDADCETLFDNRDGFFDGASYVKAEMTRLDKEKIDIFSTRKYRLLKLFALLGDHFRIDAVFPMDKDTTPTIELLNAYYADMAAYQYRNKVGVWTDAGEFGRTDYSHITPVSKTVSLFSKQSFRSTGAYALPGETITVTRTDSSDVSVSVFVNTIGDDSTHVFTEEFGYNRPRFLKSSAIPVANGETIYFTSSSGGPIQLEFGNDNLPVELVFENVGEHPYYRDTSDSISFATSLNAAEYDWVELSFPAVEIHSRRENMQSAFALPVVAYYGGTPDALIETTSRYIHNLPLTLAGFQGPAVELVDEIHQFAIDNNLPVYNPKLVNHINSDQPGCESNCAGSPFGTADTFNPTGQAELHGLGHALEKELLRFDGWPAHVSSDLYSFYAKSHYYSETGLDPACKPISFKHNYTVLQNSFTEPDPAAYVTGQLWQNQVGEEGAAMLVQLFMLAQDLGAVTNGWHLLPRMHIIERAYRESIADNSLWLTNRNGLGMSLLTYDQANMLSQSDFMLLAASHASGYDLRAYFDVWAHQYSTLVSDQIQALSLPSAPLNYYVSSPDGFCKGEGFNGNKIPIDGSDTPWPLPD